MQELPAPYEGPIVRNAPLTVPRAGWQPQLPDGFTATLYADNLENPRQIFVLPNGDVLVALQKSGSLMMLRDDNRDGRADWVDIMLAGSISPTVWPIATGNSSSLTRTVSGALAISQVPCAPQARDRKRLPRYHPMNANLSRVWMDSY
jgi:hypothetical protein